MVKLGQKVRFDPFAAITAMGIEEIRQLVSGTIVYINWKHRWFSVKYGDLMTSFHFFDIGKEVTICGRG